MRRLSLNRSEPAKKSDQNIPKNRCRTTVAERMVETRAELPLSGIRSVCLSHDQARPQPVHAQGWAPSGKWRLDIDICHPTVRLSGDVRPGALVQHFRDRASRSSVEGDTLGASPAQGKTPGKGRIATLRPADHPVR